MNKTWIDDIKEGNPPEWYTEYGKTTDALDQMIFGESKIVGLNMLCSELIHDISRMIGSMYCHPLSRIEVGDYSYHLVMCAQITDIINRANYLGELWLDIKGDYNRYAPCRK